MPKSKKVPTPKKESIPPEETLTCEDIIEDNRVVNYIYISTLPFDHTPQDGEKEENEFRIYLDLNVDLRTKENNFVIIDIFTDAKKLEPSKPRSGTLSLRTCRDTRGRWVGLHYPIPAMTELRVKDIAYVIFERKRHQYELSDNGTGTRYWVYTVLQDLCAQQDSDGQNWFEKIPDQDFSKVFDYTYYLSPADDGNPLIRRAIPWYEGTFTSDKAGNPLASTSKATVDTGSNKELPLDEAPTDAKRKYLTRGKTQNHPNKKKKSGETEKEERKK